MVKVAIGGYNDTLALYELDINGGPAKPLGGTQGKHASWLVPHPSVSDIWFATSEIDPGAVGVYQVNQEGPLVLVGSHPTGGSSPCHLAVSDDGADLFAGNYMSGDVSVIGILKAPPYLGVQNGDQIVQHPSQVIPFAYTVPATGEPQGSFNPSRQEGSHPHQILVLGAPHNEVLVADLGSDKIWRLQKTGNHAYAVRGYVPFPVGSGPRHAVLIDNVLYTVCELSNQLAANRLPPLPAPAEPIAYLPTLPTPATLKGATSTSGGKVLLPSELAYTSSVPSTPPEPEDDPMAEANKELAIPPPAEEAGKAAIDNEPPKPALAAEILAPLPLVDGAPRLLYVSNRNEIAPPHTAIGDIGGDTIATFSLVPNFALVERVRTGVNHARAVAFSDDGRHLVVVGQDGGGANLFAREPETGKLVYVRNIVSSKETGGPTLPTSVTFVG
ncbi:3-carboxy-cis,cis-mucoante lactonizing enzyme [Auriculariales sp. MPI-PUGE-AT-0066]|nr:3-carboxy-cis,cis-mucoante lactonizing enzyme [Auriculariales sp. MPI-PUGE-AT-0066]